jgi:hypothetical protein
VASTSLDPPPQEAKAIEATKAAAENPCLPPSKLLAGTIEYIFLDIVLVRQRVDNFATIAP